MSEKVWPTTSSGAETKNILLSYLYYTSRKLPVNPAETALWQKKGWHAFCPAEKIKHPRIRTKDADKRKGCWRAR